MMRYEKAILETILDKYERSRSFTGDNKKEQRFSVKLTKMFPKYGDEAEYDLLTSLNSAVDELESAGLVYAKRKKNGLTDTVSLNTASLEEAYKYISRTPKAEVNDRLFALLDKYSDSNTLLSQYCEAQKQRLALNKRAEYFDGDLEEYEMVLKAVSNIFNVEEETFIRDYSVKVFGDSKAFEAVMGKVRRLLLQYGDFPDEESVFEDLNIIKNPGHVFIKGCAVIQISGQTIDLSRLNGDIAISSSLLPRINEIKVTGSRVVTIENLTTFNTFSEDDAFVMYLGGYHNEHRRKFIKQIYSDNPNAEYYHFGDIDAGGFYILLHLREKTGVHFEAYRMGIPELIRYSSYTKKLTENDIKRLKKLLDSEFAETVRYMLEHNCKLEQEAVGGQAAAGSSAVVLHDLKVSRRV